MPSVSEINNRLSSIDQEELYEAFQQLSPCNICPRECNADRLNGETGYCNTDDSFRISSICIHRGEEPVISGSKGICNIFFTNCNLQCKYCQNYQISFNCLNHDTERMTLAEVMYRIINILEEGIKAVGFVSPSHDVPQVKVIIKALKALGYDPAFVYNSNGYDRVEELRKLEGLVDVYLPDFKYMDEKIAEDYSDAPDYPQIALNAIKEMYRQVGAKIHLNKDGQAERGMVIRHLVLPGHAENSIKVLQEIAQKISPVIPISLMSQYYPTHHVAALQYLGRTLKKTEYQMVVDAMEKLGMYNGWIQDMDSYENYRPDFERKEHPFE
ncbi:MAG: radical SAM protein [Bacteroidales bacterium]|nr:radical SAM protein [Bacteroidales bacterium]MCF8350656.1 radical SAM protein [Bacteroidales bacterium]MCF8376522.1 radical SAM protein [Bacteroidales bacterium]MCF8400626.1 radical SAM protein [Bacteroidales bacterium]